MSEQLKRDYEIGEEIGRGRFGVVHRCASRATGEAFAVKSVDRSALADDLDRALAELEPKLARLACAGGENPGVVQVRAVYEDGAWTHTVMDLCTGPDLLDWLRLRRGAPVPEPDAARVVAQLAEALAGCHRAGVVHRDVKPTTSSSTSTPPGRRPRGCGSRTSGGEYGEKVDVWSAGVVLYALLSGGALPFGGETPAEVFAAVLRGTLRFPPALFAGISPAAKDLMRRMMCRDVSRRFSAEQVLRHPWIQSGGGTREAVQPT
ncbi:hypothetical protein HU200_001364 [Digitaria exilis]|uniref:Protein kinase domain-containing protein n=1 Tax=Digitaria exilis TaxID=1010633 RepID=A0A835G094_9POAL|nr:hypothetical protein HU200_001364 [Digitaria exilis]